MSDSWKADRIGSALNGTNPTILTRLSSSFAAIGDVQFLPGYSVLLSTTRADRLLDLPRQRRRTVLADMDLLGEAAHIVCSERDPAFRRINYEIHGNRDAILHAHIWPRYDWEADKHRTSPVGLYPARDMGCTRLAARAATRRPAQPAHLQINRLASNSCQ